MDLYDSSAEYVSWTITADNPLNCLAYVAYLAVNAEPTNSTVWSVASWVDEVATTRTLTALVAGPAVTSVPVGGVKLPRGTWQPWIKLNQDPEVIIRSSTDQITIK